MRFVARLLQENLQVSGTAHCTDDRLRVTAQTGAAHRLADKVAQAAADHMANRCGVALGRVTVEIGEFRQSVESNGLVLGPGETYLHDATRTKPHLVDRQDATMTLRVHCTVKRSDRLGVTTRDTAALDLIAALSSGPAAVGLSYIWHNPERIAPVDAHLITDEANTDEMNESGCVGSPNASDVIRGGNMVFQCTTLDLDAGRRVWRACAVVRDPMQVYCNIYVSMSGKGDNGSAAVGAPIATTIRGSTVSCAGTSFAMSGLLGLRAAMGLLLVSRQLA